MRNQYVNALKPAIIRDLAAAMPSTKKQIGEIIRAHRSDTTLSIAAAIDLAGNAVREIRNSRNSRNKRRIARRVPADRLANVRYLRPRTIAPIFSHDHDDRSARAAWLFNTPLAERREQRTRGAFRAARPYGLRCGGTMIALTDNPAQVGAAQNSYLDWNYYAKSCRYPKKITTTTITIPRYWITRVGRTGLECAGELWTLDLARLDHADPAVYAATWIEQGRGNEVRAVRGYIAGDRECCYHSDSVAGAITGYRRKRDQRATTPSERSERAARARHAHLRRLAERYPDLIVSIDDAHEIGACAYGIRSWCERTGLDYAARSAPLSAVFAAYSADPMSEARAAILFAVRRHNSRTQS